MPPHLIDRGGGPQPGLGPTYDTLVEALRVALRADDVQVTPGTVPRPRGDTSRLSIDTGHPGGTTVHIDRPQPFDDTDERVARAVVQAVGLVRELWAQRSDRAAGYIETVLVDLDGMATADVDERLGLVARSACEWFGAAGWAVGFLDRGAVVPRSAAWPCVDGTTLEDCLGRRPVVSPLILDAFEGGSFAVGAGDDDQAGDLLRGCGMRSLVGGGGYDVDALQWMVLVVADREDALWPARPAVSAAVQAALGFPRAPRARR